MDIRLPALLVGIDDGYLRCPKVPLQPVQSEVGKDLPDIHLRFALLRQIVHQRQAVIGVTNKVPPVFPGNIHRLSSLSPQWLAMR